MSEIESSYEGHSTRTTAAALDVGATLEKRINENHWDHEQRIKDLESQVRELFSITEQLEARLHNLASAEHVLRRRVDQLVVGGDEGVVTLRITAERGTR